MKQGLLFLFICLSINSSLAKAPEASRIDLLYDGDKIPHSVCKLIQGDPDNEPLGYSKGTLYPLTIAAENVKLFERFCIVISSDGIGHLEARSENRNPKVQRPIKNDGLYRLKDALVFTETGKEPKTLTLPEATRLFGNAFEQQSQNGNFYTINAKAKSLAEENIYHLDFRAAKDGQIASYRVRGIGITNPQWITE